MRNKKIIYIASIATIILAMFIGTFFVLKNSKNETKKEKQIYTTEKERINEPKISGEESEVAKERNIKEAERIISLSGIISFTKHEDASNYVIIEKNGKETIVESAHDYRVNKSQDSLSFDNLEFSPNEKYLKYYAYDSKEFFGRIYDIESNKIVLKIVSPTNFEFINNGKHLYACAVNNLGGHYYARLYKIPSFELTDYIKIKTDTCPIDIKCNYDEKNNEFIVTQLNKDTGEKEEIYKISLNKQEEVNTDWNIDLSNDEIKSENTLTDNNLIYATKEDYTVQVLSRNFQTGEETKILEYDEDRKAINSGNYYEGLQPSMDLSNNKNSVVFVDQEGLKTYNIKTSETNTLIYKTSIDESNIEVAPKWSIEKLNAHTLTIPKWSADDEYIIFEKSHMEGAGLGVINVATKNYTPLMSNNLPIGYNHPTWGNSGHALIKPSSGVYDGNGLYFTSEDFTNVNNLSKNFDKEKSLFLRASLSYDNKKAVFTYKENYEDEVLKIGIVYTNGSNFKYIDEGNIQAPIFCKNKTNCLMFIKEINNKYYLIEYNTTTKGTNIIAKMPEQLKYWEKPAWTDDGFFVVTAMSSKSASVDEKNTKLLILNLSNKKLIYASAFYNRFVNFAGFR